VYDESSGQAPVFSVHGNSGAEVGALKLHKISAHRVSQSRHDDKDNVLYMQKFASIYERPESQAEREEILRRMGQYGRRWKR